MRNEKWKQETIANTSQEQFNREFECEFLGSINTLIHPTKIKSMVFDEPIQRNAGLELYKKPEKGEHMHYCLMLQGEQNKTTLHF